ncbi:sensor histidine kinase [Guyparkeria hydrothermalis]|uniref:sensor histidine kinase n=1 Tax=Guyparkeria hydrothermalis TaxID=923 RepID=UPI0020212F3A|nr:sensor histidine kinase [Guyparkeria hydrothermalis]MCL7745293.1 sensor histidine kinase [Guyparkeria hydrothermalis]
MKRLRPRHIQTRLTLWLLASVVALFGLYWVVTAKAPVMLTEGYVVDRLAHDAENLVLGLDTTEPHATLSGHFAAPIYDRPYSGHYFLMRVDGQNIRSRSLWDFEFTPRAVDTFPTTYHAKGPLEQDLLVYVDRITKDGHAIEVHVAEDLSALHQRISTYRWQFGVVSVLLLVALVVLQRWIVRSSLRPLDRVRADCRRLERGEIDQLDRDVPPELLPMVDEINHLQAVTQRRLARSRRALGNLAHALKTPLTLIDQVGQRIRDRLDPRDAESLDEAVTRMRRITDRELRQARLAGQARAGERFDLGHELPRLFHMFERLHADKALSCRLEAPANVALRAEREDMYELFGNLLDNAAKWAQAEVVVSIEPVEDGWHIRVADDGPGVASQSLDALAERGTRLDESRDGHGLGLAIVREIVELYGGRLAFSRSVRLGGLQVDVWLP